MDEGTINTPYPKCRLYWCSIEFIDWRQWRYSKSCWCFRPILWTLAPLPSLWPPPALPPFQSQLTLYTDSVWLWGGGGRRRRGVLSCVVDHILQKFSTLFLTSFRTYKIATPPQTKTPVKTTFRDWCLYSFFVHCVEYEGGWGQICWVKEQESEESNLPNVHIVRPYVQQASFSTPTVTLSSINDLYTAKNIHGISEITYMGEITSVWGTNLSMTKRALTFTFTIIL
jgi:hypothetical protein